MGHRTTIFLIFFVHFIFLQIQVFGQENNKLYNLIYDAEEREDEKKYTLAIEIYNKALVIARKENLTKDISRIHWKLGLLYYRQKLYRKSKLNFKKSIQKETKSKTAADCYFNLSLIYRKQQSRDSLLWALSQSLRTYETLKDGNDKFNTHHKAGIIYKQLGLYKKAIQSSIVAYDGFSLLKNFEKKAATCNNIGGTQRLMGNYESAKKYLLESLNLRQILRDTLKISHASNNLANLLKDTKKYDSAIVYYNRAIDIQKGIKPQQELGKMLNNLASAYFLNNAFDKAFNTYKKALTFKKKDNDSLSIILTYNELANIFLTQKRFVHSRKYLDSTKFYISETTIPEGILRYYELESNYHKGVQNFNKANFYKELEYDLYRDLFSKEQTKTIQTLQAQFESKLKEQKITQLSKETEAKESIINLQDARIKNRNLLLILFGSGLLLILGAYFYFRQQQKIRIKSLENDKLKAVLDVQEKIKNHISKDLHDMIPTSYDAIRLKILALTKTKNPKEVGESIIEDIKRVNEEIRLISHRLSPLGGKLKSTKLTEIIENHLTEFQYYRHVFIDVRLPFPEALNQMRIEAKTNFYGIILEVLNNIEKHSKANKIEIKHLIKDEEQFVFEICDNGIGLKKKHGNGIGLTNIEQRTLLLKGTFNINSSEKGTCVKLNFPLKPNL